MTTLGSATNACDVYDLSKRLPLLPSSIFHNQLLFHRVLPSTYYVPSVVLDVGNIRVSKISWLPSWKGRNESNKDTKESVICKEALWRNTDRCILWQSLHTAADSDSPPIERRGLCPLVVNLGRLRQLPLSESGGNNAMWFAKWGHKSHVASCSFLFTRIVSLGALKCCVRSLTTPKDLLHEEV